MTALTAPTTPLTVLAGVGPKTIEKIEAAGITSMEKLASMTPEQLMEIPGIGEKMVDKIYQAVNRFYESGETGAAAAEGATETAEEAAEETAEEVTEAEEAAAETEAEKELENAGEKSTAENHSAAAEPKESESPEGQQEEKNS